MKKVLGIVLTLTIAFAMAACGAKEDSVRAVSASDGYKCETCKKKTAATYERRRRPLPLLKLQMVLLPEFMRRL